MKKYQSKELSRKATPQSEPIPNSGQVQNNAGGYGWAVNDWTQLDRFLILGAEGPTYYVKEKALAKTNAEATVRCIQADGLRAVQRIVEISDTGRAPKNDPALFALALAMTYGNAETKKAAYRAVPKVARIGTHIFHLTEYVNTLRGWSAGLRRAISAWYLNQDPSDLAYQIVKYQSRDGWNHRDVMRLAHPPTKSTERAKVFDWTAKGKTEWADSEGKALEFLMAFERLSKATTASEAVKLIAEYNFPREAVPTQLLNDPAVWDALLPKMGITALLRNLATMTRAGVLEYRSDNTTEVIRRIRSFDILKKGRVHPIAVLSALRTYASGHGARGQHTWTPIRKIEDALDDAFYISFGTVVPSNKSLLLALDVSGSMEGGEIAGVPGLTPRDGSAAMALVTAATEPNYEIVGFTASGIRRGYIPGNSISPLKITPKMSLNDAIKVVSGLDFGATDCALPVLYAQQSKKYFDGFVVYTDSETWAGHVHPSQALKTYRSTLVTKAKLVVVGMVSNGFTIADPNDPGMVDVVGFDTATPQLITDFVGDGF